LESTKGYNSGIEATLSRLESQWKQSLQEVEAHVKSEAEKRASEMQQMLLLQRGNGDVDAESVSAKIQALTQELGRLFSCFLSFFLSSSFFSSFFFFFFPVVNFVIVFVH
jgi:hypothetical protein